MNIVQVAVCVAVVLIIAVCVFTGKGPDQPA
jgi:hypothetical protein